MNKRQQAFVTEYALDHNATQAAIRAGYSSARAKQTGSELLAKPEIAQAIAALDAERRQAVGVSVEWVVEQLVAVYEKSMEGAPKVDRKGRLIRVFIDGQEVIVKEWSPSGATKSLELLMKHLGMTVERHQVEVTGDVVYTLTLDRELAGPEE